MNVEGQYQSLIQKIAENLKYYRRKSGFTQEGMVKFGFNYRHYQKLESGSHSPSLFTLFKLAKIFKTDLVNLLK